MQETRKERRCSNEKGKKVQATRKERRYYVQATKKERRYRYMQLFPMAAFQMKHKNLWVMPSYSTVATCGEPSCIELLRRESKSSPVLMDERATDLLSDWIDRQSGSTTCEVKKKTKIPTQNY